MEGTPSAIALLIAGGLIHPVFVKSGIRRFYFWASSRYEEPQTAARRCKRFSQKMFDLPFFGEQIPMQQPMSRESRHRKQETRQRSRRLGRNGFFIRTVAVLVLIGIVLSYASWRHYGGSRVTIAGHVKSPTSYLELCALKTNELHNLDIALMNLLCAEGLRGSEDLEVNKTLVILDNMVKSVESETQRYTYKFREHPEEYNRSEGYYKMMMMVTVLQQDLGIHYNPNRLQLPGQSIEPNSAFFADSKDVFIHGLARKNGAGTCSSMPVLLVSIGRRLGYPLKLVGAKGHLFVRWDDGQNRFNIEGASTGFVSETDEYYRTWPAPFSTEEEQSEGYLKNMTSSQELAVFLSIRGMCLDAAGERRKSLGAFAQAFYKEPNSVTYQRLFRRAEALVQTTEMSPPRRALLEECLQISISIGPNSSYLTAQKGMLLMKLNDPQVSDQDIAMAMEIFKQEVFADQTPQRR
jgi:hypothetical protein